MHPHLVAFEELSGGVQRGQRRVQQLPLQHEQVGAEVGVPGCEGPSTR